MQASAFFPKLGIIAPRSFPITQAWVILPPPCSPAHWHICMAEQRGLLISLYLHLSVTPEWKGYVCCH